jgi:aldose sugar dehydrogenase
MKLAKTAALAALAATGASAQTNLGAQKLAASLPFVMTKVATFNLPWRLAFLPDGQMLITEKVGPHLAGHPDR